MELTRATSEDLSRAPRKIAGDPIFAAAQKQLDGLGLGSTPYGVNPALRV
jgi:hypothetical protein